MKILNLFAGIGGNRTLWGDKHEITAVEIDPEIAEIYKKRFPNDKIIIGDAYQYLEDHYQEYDFIWASPPCPTHSKLMFCQERKKLPDMRLYSIIIFLQHHFRGIYCVENVQAYYDFITPTIILGRHSFWTNINIKKRKFINKYRLVNANISDLKEEHHCEDLELNNDYEVRRILRNCVKPKIGKYILDSINNKPTITLLNYLKQGGAQ